MSTIAKDKLNILFLDPNSLIENLNFTEIDITVLETQYTQLEKQTQKIQSIAKRLKDNNQRDNLISIIKESKIAIVDISTFLKEIKQSVFHIFSSKYMKTQTDENKKKSIQIEVMLVSLLETIPSMIKSIVRYETKNKKSLITKKPKVTISHKNLLRLEGEQKSISDKSDLFNSFTDSIGSYFNDEEDNSIQEIRADLERMRKSEGEICINIETIIECINQSQYEYSLVGIPNKVANQSNSIVEGVSWKGIIVFFVIILVLCIIGIPLYFLLKKSI